MITGMIAVCAMVVMPGRLKGRLRLPRRLQPRRLRTALLVLGPKPITRTLPHARTPLARNVRERGDSRNTDTIAVSATRQSTVNTPNNTNKAVSEG